MKPDTIRFILSEIAKEMQIADIERQLYLIKRREINLKRLEDTEARKIYNIMKAIAEPIHAYNDQMVAIAKWIESEFEYKPQKQVNNAAPELLEACKEALKHHQGGHSEIGHMLRNAIKKAE